METRDPWPALSARQGPVGQPTCRGRSPRARSGGIGGVRGEERGRERERARGDREEEGWRGREVTRGERERERGGDIFTSVL